MRLRRGCVDASQPSSLLESRSARACMTRARTHASSHIHTFSPSVSSFPPSPPSLRPLPPLHTHQLTLLLSEERDREPNEDLPWLTSHPSHPLERPNCAVMRAHKDTAHKDTQHDPAV